MIDAALIAAGNDAARASLDEDYGALGRRLARRSVSIAGVKEQVKRFAVAIPSWGVGTGGTRFARFPGLGEPRGIYDKIEDCGVIRQLSAFATTVSPHFPWDHVDDSAALRVHAERCGLSFDAVNSNTFQSPVSGLSYRFGSLSHVDGAVRAQAVEHNIECIRIGRQLGSRALTVWIGDGANFAGQSDMTAAFDRYLGSMTQIYAALPDDWTLLIEHKLYEPAFYTTVIADWGTSYIAASELGPKARCLVDLGHHAPSTNIEQIVARLARFGKLGGFHFNDSKYGDDDLDTGSINPFQLFLVFNELAIARARDPHAPEPALMLDQSHNVTDPIESLIISTASVASARARALLVDREALGAAQEANDALAAHLCLKRAYETEVEPLVAMARLELDGAIDPLAVYRASGYRARKAAERPAGAAGSAGIV